MARRRGTFTLSSNIELEAGAPLDSRDIVQNKTDLTNGSFPYSYVGMETYVRSEDKKYRLIGDDPTVLSNWVEVGSGSGSEVELVEISEEDYAALTTEEKNDPTKVYFRYEAIGLFKSVQDDPEATAFEGEKLATGRTIESVVDGKLEGKLDLTGGTMTGDLLTDTQTDIHAQRNLYLGNNGTSEESEGRSQLHFRRKGGGTNGITTLAPLQSKGTDDSYDENHYTQHLQCKSGTIALLDDVNKKADSETVEGSTSVSGNPIVISDAANSYAEEVIANIEPIQDLHGYDHPWVGGAGKNLYVGSPSFQGYITNGTWESVSETYNGHPVMKQTAKAWGGLYKRIYLENGSYIFSAMVKTGSSSRVFIFALGTPDPVTISPENSHAYTINTSWTRISFSFQVTTAGYLALRAEAETAVDLYISEYQLEKGSSATDYEPYENISPITGIDQLDIDGCGKNLFDLTQYTQYKREQGVTFTINSDGSVTANGTATSQSQIYWIIPEEVAKSFSGMILNGAINSNCTVRFEKAENPWTKYAIDTGKGATIGEIPDGVGNCVLICRVEANTTINGTFYPMIRPTSITDPTFEPYTPNNHTTDLGRTVYGGTLNVQTGELVLTHGFDVFDGSDDERWSLISVAEGNLFRIALSNRKFGVLFTEVSAYCNEFPIVNYDLRTNNTLSGGATNIDIIKNDITSVADFKAWLANNPLQVCYELATPQTYRLTPSQVKLLLNHNNISTNADSLDIVYQVNNVLGEILSESEEYTDRAILDYLKRNFIYKPGDVLTFDRSKPTILYGLIQNSNQIWIAIPLNKLITASAFTANITTIYVRTTNKTLLTVTPIKYQIQTMDTQKTQLVVVVNCIDGSNTTPFANLDNSPCIPIIIGTITFE